MDEVAEFELTSGVVVVGCILYYMQAVSRSSCRLERIANPHLVPVGCT